jgi:hypothetical protein
VAQLHELQRTRRKPSQVTGSDHALLIPELAEAVSGATTQTFAHDARHWLTMCCACHAVAVLCEHASANTGHAHSGPQDSSSPLQMEQRFTQQVSNVVLREGCNCSLGFCGQCCHAAMGGASGWPQLLLNHRLSQCSWALAEAHTRWWTQN